MPTIDQLADKGKQLARMYIATNDIGDLEAMSVVVEHAMAYAYRIGYRSQEGAQRAGRSAAMRRVAAILDDRGVFSTWDDFLEAIVDAALMGAPS
jgi:hypothetical protein